MAVSSRWPSCFKTFTKFQEHFSRFVVTLEKPQWEGVGVGVGASPCPITDKVGISLFAY